MTENSKRAVALGLFDGVHLGHREVIGYPVKHEKSGFIPSVFTFGSNSLSEKQGRKIEYIYTDSQKKRLIEALGIHEVFSSDFEEIKMLTGEEFAMNILVKKLHAAYVVCGKDFRFGSKASCGIKELAEFGRKYGFEAEIAEDVQSGGENVSSNRIREMLKAGEIQSANRLLGENYRIDGEVVHGRQLGRTLNFPTVNQLYGENQLIPRKGVYFSETEADGIHYASVTNIGVKPTVGAEANPLAETHILDYSGNLYGKSITVRLKEFVRDERKFSSAEELRRQIEKDTEYCRSMAGKE